MKILGVIIFVALAILVAWLVVDTTRYVIKKVKEKKAKKNKKDETTEIK